MSAAVPSCAGAIHPRGAGDRGGRIGAATTKPALATAFALADRQGAPTPMRDQADTSACETRPREAYVYFMQAENGGPVKIGFTDNPSKRLEMLQVGHPYTLVIRHLLRGTIALERRLQRKYGATRLRGEWFEPTAEMAEEGRVMHDGVLPTPVLTPHEIRKADVKLVAEVNYGVDYLPAPGVLNALKLPPKVEVNTAEPVEGEAWSSEMLG